MYVVGWGAAFHLGYMGVSEILTLMVKMCCQAHHAQSCLPTGDRWEASGSSVSHLPRGNLRHQIILVGRRQAAFSHRGKRELGLASREVCDLVAVTKAIASVLPASTTLTREQISQIMLIIL